MNLLEIFNGTGRIPIDERGVKIHGCKIRGVNYCVVSRFRSGERIEEKIKHLVMDELSSLELNKKENETSSGLDMDKDNG